MDSGVHSVCSINYGHLTDLQKTLPTKKNKLSFDKIYPRDFFSPFLFDLYLFYVTMMLPGQCWPPIGIWTSLEVRTNLEPSMVSQIPPTFIDILMTSFSNIILIG